MSWEPIEAVGSALVAMAIGAVGWIMSTFTNRHIETLDKVASKLGDLSASVAEVQADVRSVREHDRLLGERVSRLESQYFHKGE